MVALELEEAIQKAAVDVEVQRKLQSAVDSMTLLFGGFALTSPSTWRDHKPTLLAFLTTDCALAFAAGLQKVLLHAPWSDRELEVWGGREVGLLGKLSFAGPRVKCALDLQSSDNVLLGGGVDEEAGCLALLPAAHGGQVRFPRLSPICSATRQSI
jgi:hypothetical protein